MSCSCCTCDTSTSTTTVGCCSLEDTLPSSLTAVKWVYRIPAAGAPAGIEIPVYDMSLNNPTALVLTANNVLWVESMSVSVSLSGDVHIYKGTSITDDTKNNATLMRQAMADNSVLVWPYSWQRITQGEKLFVKTASVTTSIDVVGYGRLQSV